MPGMEDIAQLLQSLLSADNNGNNGDNADNTATENNAVDRDKSGFANRQEHHENHGGEQHSTENSGGFDGLGALGALAGMFGGGGETGDGIFGGLDFDMLMKMGMIFAQFQKPDKNVTLLTALKPMMRTENQTKIDTAMKLVRIMGMLPYLRESGLLDKLF